MWPNLQETADLVTFAEEILSRKLHFLCSVLSLSQLSLLASCCDGKHINTWLGCSKSISKSLSSFESLHDSTKPSTSGLSITTFSGLSINHDTILWMKSIACSFGLIELHLSARSIWFRSNPIDCRFSLTSAAAASFDALLRGAT